jgi:hypothetical protein
MPVNTAWEDVVQGDQNEQDQAARDAEHRDAYRKQVDEWRRQISSCCTLHQAWIDIPFYQAIPTRRIPPQRLEHQSCDHQRASIDDDRNPLLRILPQQRCGEREKHNAQQQQNVEPEQVAIRALDVVEGIVMCDPVDAHEHKTQRVAQELGPQFEQFGHEFASCS